MTETARYGCGAFGYITGKATGISADPNTLLSSLTDESDLVLAKPATSPPAYSMRVALAVGVSVGVRVTVLVTVRVAVLVRMAVRVAVRTSASKAPLGKQCDTTPTTQQNRKRQCTATIAC